MGGQCAHRPPRELPPPFLPWEVSRCFELSTMDFVPVCGFYFWLFIFLFELSPLDFVPVCGFFFWIFMKVLLAFVRPMDEER